MRKEVQPYLCNKLGCEAPGTKWIKFGGTEPAFSYCPQHAASLLAHKEDFLERERPVEIKGMFTHSKRA